MNSAEPGSRLLAMEDIARAAQGELDAYRARVAGLPYEAKGILYSEMFLFYLCAKAAGAGRIVESGRARGQSTLVLATCFPDRPIVSIEYDERSPDVPVAAARLRGFANVELLFGDATRLLPGMVQPGDVVIIDGPKGYRALRLALKLLAQGRAAMVFLHDVGREAPERALLEKHLPATLYSDDPRFARLAHRLDQPVRHTIPRGHQWEDGEAPLGYGYTLACLQHDAGAPYRKAWWAAVLEGLTQRRTRPPA